MGAQRTLWMRILLCLVLAGMGLLLLSWYLERETAASSEGQGALLRRSLPAMRYVDPLPGQSRGLPIRARSQVEVLELVQLPLGAEVENLACLLDLGDLGLSLRRPAQAPSRIFLRAVPLAHMSPLQRALVLQALEELCASWNVDPSELRFPPGEAFRTLALWMRRDPIPWARR
jgi:hypothetical protein